MNDMVLESRVLTLLEENAHLQAELLALQFRFGLVKDLSSTPILPLTKVPHHTRSHYLSNSPIFKDWEIKQDRLSPHRAEQLGYDLNHSPVEVLHAPGLTVKLNQAETLKNLSHKLRFKMLGSGDTGDGGGISPQCSPTLTTAGPYGLRKATKGLSKSETGAGHCTESRLQQIEGEEHSRGRQSPQYYPLPGTCSLQMPLQNDDHYKHESTQLKSQLNSLSKEVAHLKKLFAEQLMAKVN